MFKFEIVINEIMKNISLKGNINFDKKKDINDYELFLKNEWKIIRKEKVIINNIFFERYKMTKIIKN